MQKRTALALALPLSIFLGCSRDNPSAAPLPTQPSFSSTSAVSAAPSPAPVSVGGGCKYDKVPGTCSVLEGGMVTFEGTVSGAPVKLEGNKLFPNGQTPVPAPGSKTPCTLDFETAGTCTPCMLSIAECGASAWELFRNRKR